MEIRTKIIETVTRIVEVDGEYIEAGYRHLATRYFVRVTAEGVHPRPECDFYGIPINFCPMCGRKLKEEII